MDRGEGFLMRGRSAMELETRDEGEIRRMPVGIRLTILFLRIMLVCMMILLVGGLLTCLGSLWWAAKSGEDFLGALKRSVGSLGGFVALFATARGTEWMWHFLRARHSPQEGPLGGMPRHPAIVIGHPSLHIIFAYSILSLGVWVILKIGQFVPMTWAWPVFWWVVAVGAHYGIKVLKQRFPG